jgi:hypothetical protein
MMESKEDAALLWKQWVGWFTPTQFMDRAHHWALLEGGWWTTARKAVRAYMERLDAIFGPGTSDRAPKDLEEVLVRYITVTLGIEEDAPWCVAA